jgi:large conductance mechanosensitive channel
MSFINEFKNFAVKGNVIDLAVGVIIGGAFGKIVSSLVSDVIMPPIGVLVGGINFTDIVIKLKSAGVDAAGQIIPAVTINLGNFIQAVIDFTIVAFVIFMAIRTINRLKYHQPEVPVDAPEPSKEEQLLAEIRDLLKEKK